MAEAQAHETLEKMYKFRASFKGLNQTFGGDRAPVVELFDLELICLRSTFTAALSESKDTVNDAIYNAYDNFPVGLCFDALVPSASGSSDQA